MITPRRALQGRKTVKLNRLAKIKIESKTDKEPREEMRNIYFTKKTTIDLKKFDIKEAPALRSSKKSQFVFLHTNLLQ